MKFASIFVKEKIGDAEIAIVLGSGLGDLVEILQDKKVILVDFKSIEYTDIPFMPQTSVIGHGKHLYRGLIGDKRVLCWSGKIL